VVPDTVARAEVFTGIVLTVGFVAVPVYFFAPEMAVPEDFYVGEP
jgi:hypothetical protein